MLWGPQRRHRGPCADMRAPQHRARMPHREWNAMAATELASGHATCLGSRPAHGLTAGALYMAAALEVLEVTQHLRQQLRRRLGHQLFAIRRGQELERRRLAPLTERAERRVQARSDERPVALDVAAKVRERARVSGQ